MLYRKKDSVYSRAGAITAILSELGSAIEPSYIDDDTLALYGFTPVLKEGINPKQVLVGKEGRKEALNSTDWISAAKHLTKDTKAAVEAWRQVVRDCPDCSVLPPLPKLVATKTKAAAPLNQTELDAIKNYVTEDESWLLFLQTWKDLGFPNSKNIVTNLLIAYTKVKLDEIIGGI